MQIAHEAPLAVFDIVEQKTDYLYALVHLFEESEEYYNKFKDGLNRGKRVILDTSIFELGTAFESDRFLYWVNKLQPTEYIIPDALEDSYKTITQLGEWQALYQPQVKYTAKTIGVVQGRSYDDFVWCYNNIEPHVDKVAISFDYSFLIPANAPSAKKEQLYMLGRQQLLKSLLRDNVINTGKPHHLLGCYCPQEFKAYKDYEWVNTIDTSNPVVAGIKGIKYGDNGLNHKPNQKLFTMMYEDLSEEQINLITYNIEKFRTFTK